MVVYLDLVMILNFLVDLMLLIGTNRLSGYPAAVGRCAIGAGVGGLYSGACLLPGFHFLGNGLWRIIWLALLASAAFGWSRSGLRRGTVFVLLSLALGGMVLAMGEGRFGRLILSAAVIWFLCHMGFGGQLGQEFLPICVWQGEDAFRFMALRDTGNTLRDPITGEQVIVMDVNAAQKLTGLSLRELVAPMETVIRYPGFRLIPYHAVGQPAGMLLAKRYGDVTVGNYRGGAILAFAPEIIDRAGNYQALAGGTV